jgi:chromosome segregation ATPase
MNGDRGTVLPGPGAAADPLAAIRLLGTAFDQATSLLSGPTLAGRGLALEACLELARALDRAGPLDAALQAALELASPGRQVADAVEAARGRLAETRAQVDRLAAQVAELEGTDSELREREEEGRRLVARQEELARLAALAPDLATLRQERAAVEREIDGYEATAAAESGLMTAAGRMRALLTSRLEAFQAETVRALEDADKAAAELTDAHQALTRQRRQAEAEVGDLEARLAVLEEERRQLASRLVAARERYGEVAAEREALLIPLQRYVAADTEVADALDRYRSEPDSGDIRQALAAVERRLHLVDEALRESLMARQSAYDTEERHDRR